MSDFIVNESNFIIEDDLYESSFVPEGFMLPDGIVFGEKLDEAPSWELYLSEDLQFRLLVVKEALAEQWVDGHLIPQSALMPMELKDGVFYLLISPSSLKLQRLSQCRFNGSLRYAFSFYSALQHTRTLDAEHSLRDGIFFELYSVILPCYTLVPPVADRALFRNALRGKNDPELLLSSEEMGGSGGLVYASCLKDLRDHDYAVPKEQPLLESGEPVDDFFMGKVKVGQIITGPLCIRRQYQIFDTSTDYYVLLIDKLWGDALLHTTVLSRITLNTVPLNGRAVYVLTLPKRQALEALDDRSFGYDRHSMMDLAQAVRRTRAAVPQADLRDGLYVAKLGMILPLTFSAGSYDDGKVMWDIIQQGPFSSAPLMQDIAYDILSVARSSD